jgi:IS5 family transposase
MRPKTKNIFPEFFRLDNESMPENTKANKNVQHYRDLYKTFDEYLKKYPEIEQLAHEDLEQLCKSNSTRNRTPDFTTQNLFRAVLVYRMEQLSLRDTEVAIAESKTLQNFCRLDKKETISFQLIDQAHLAIKPETWQSLNRFFATRMVAEEKINPDFVRSDGTVVETNIHYPTDSSLCYDCYRTVSRIVKNAREAGLGPVLKGFRFHVAKIKTLNFRINQNASAKSDDRKQRYKNDYDTIISRTEDVVRKAEEIVCKLQEEGSELAMIFAAQVSGYLPFMKTIVSVARRRFNGEKVPNDEKVFSLFEPHTELIKKGKKDKPIEFGHLIFITQTRQKFITDCILTEKSPSESAMLPDVVDRHEDQFGRKPVGIAMDKGCHPGKEKMEDLLEDYEDEVEFIGIPSRSNDFADEEMGRYQRFRAGIEGSISFLKRCFGLTRMLFKGFKGFCQGVGSAIFCHNLLVMARRDLIVE